MVLRDYGDLSHLKPHKIIFIYKSETFSTEQRYVDKTGAIHYLCQHQSGRLGSASTKAATHRYGRPPFSKRFDNYRVWPHQMVVFGSGKSLQFIFLIYFIT